MPPIKKPNTNVPTAPVVEETAPVVEETMFNENDFFDEVIEESLTISKSKIEKIASKRPYQKTTEGSINHNKTYSMFRVSTPHGNAVLVQSDESKLVQNLNEVVKINVKVSNRTFQDGGDDKIIIEYNNCTLISEMEVDLRVQKLELMSRTLSSASFNSKLEDETVKQLLAEA